MNDIMVSVSCLAYNHEKYIRQTLEGFVNQKTNFKFEVLVHDDASTDGTADIIREYEEKYPDIIKPIYQTENQYSKKIGIQKTYQYPRAKGKYVAICEGDDYWCCDTKLQEQFDIMEENPNVALCAHKTGFISESGQDMSGAYPNNEMPEFMTSEQFLSSLLSYNRHPFHTSSFFVRKAHVLDMVNNPPEFTKVLSVGDVRILWYMSTKGDVYYINKEYSKYRILSQGSWTSRNADNVEYQVDFQKKMIKAFELFNDYTEKKFDSLFKENITRCEFNINLATGNTGGILKKEYKQFRKEMSIKQKTRYVMKTYFKPIFKVVMKIKSKRRNG